MAPSRRPASRIALQFEEGQTVPRPGDLKKLAEAVAKGEGLAGAVEIAFCADETVRALNKRHRKLDKVTDVLSFEWGEEDFAGEIYVANPQAKRQAPRFNNNYFNELRRLVVHGMLHLCGHDHMKPGERARMRALEDRYLAVPSASISAKAAKKPLKQARSTVSRKKPAA
jgi:probable rRNA maturation factor